MEPEQEERKRGRLLSSPTGRTPSQGSKRSMSRIPVARLLSSPTGRTPSQGSKRSMSRIPVASPQASTSRSGQSGKSGTSWSQRSSRIPVRSSSLSVSTCTKTGLKPSAVTPTRLSASDRLPLHPRDVSIVRKWSEEEDRALVAFILLGTPGDSWPTLKEYPAHFWESAATFVHQQTCIPLRTGNLDVHAK